MVASCISKKSLIGKTAIVTGANSGIGYETALEFAKRGCRVILACRNQRKALDARHKIIKATGNANVIVRLLNLESLASVKDFVANIEKTESRLDLLINNAETAYLPDKMTDDGLQIEMAVNYFSPFLLTILLLDLLKKSIPSRIINVSSGAASLIRNLKLDELNKHGGSSKDNAWDLYCKSKLCQIYFTQELANRLLGTGVTTYSLHPGVTSSEFVNLPTLWRWVAEKTMKSAQEGAQTTVYLALEEGIEKYTGEHFEECEKVKPYCGARDSKKREKLWDITEELVGLRTHL